MFAQHLPGLHAWFRLKCGRLVRRHESSMDVVQSVLRQVLGDLGKFEYRGPRGFRNWLLTYAVNKLRNRRQYFGAEKRQAPPATDESLAGLSTTIASLSHVLDAREQVEAFERAFARLEPRDQDVILMARIQGLSHAEIAARLQLSEAASKKAHSRAMLRLAGHLTGASGT